MDYKLIMKKKIRGIELYRKAKNVIPGGSMLFSKRSELYAPDLWPSYFNKTKGCVLWDISGKKYIDMYFGVGTNTLGYNNASINKKVKDYIDKGNMSSLNAPEEYFLAKKLISIHPWAKKVKFARSGGEANAIAIRIARAFSKKQNVAICGYHGWHDWYLSANLKNKKKLNNHLMPNLEIKGVPKNLKNTVYPFKYNDFNYLRNLIKKKNIGIIKMEVQRNYPPEKDFLKRIRKICDKNKIVLIFDECTSGFRETYGGKHLDYKIYPDIAIFGKAIGNGYAINAIIGKERVMKCAEKTFISSTFWTERIGSVAALETLNQMKKKKSYKFIKQQGKKIKKIWQNLSNDFDIKIEISGLDSIPTLNFKEDNLILKTFIIQEMLKKGFISSNVVFVSIVHTDKILSAYEKALRSVFYKIYSNKKNKKYKKLLKTRICFSPFQRMN